MFDAEFIQKTKRLLKHLKDLEGNPEIEATDFINGDTINTYYPELLSLVDEVLITADGTPNYRVMSVFKSRGFKVGPGETDSFGWVTGCIYTNKGVIVY